ncbi:MAG: DCC1-like thiol-disulfide oxidoreductase family protein [Bryobacteraceae bacterium]
MGPPHDVYYDDQCEVCQAGVSWLQALDRRGAVRPLPLSSSSLPSSAWTTACESCTSSIPPAACVRAGRRSRRWRACSRRRG